MSKKPYNGKLRLTRKHSREFIGIIESRELLQFGYHTTLAIIRSRRASDQSLSQLLLIKLLEHIFIIDELEDDHLMKFGNQSSSTHGRSSQFSDDV